MQEKRNKARVSGLRLLTAKDRTVCEIRRRLAERFSEPEVEDALEYLAQLGYLDDLRYARNYVAYRNRARPRGNYLLRLELGNKGVDHSIIAQVLNSEEEEISLALGFARDYLKRRSCGDYSQQKRRLYGALQRRGFSGSAVRRAVSELLDSDLEKEYN